MSINHDDWELLDAAADRFGIEAADANHFTRYGRSSARLFLVRPHGGGVPLLVKTDSRDAIEREAQCTRAVQPFMDDARGAEPMNMNVHGRDAIVFFIHGQVRGDSNVDELDDHYTRALQGGASGPDELDKLLELIREVYESDRLLGMAHKCSEVRTPSTFGTYFDRYERREHPDRLNQLYSSFEGKVQVCGEDVPQPLTRIDELRSLTSSLRPVDAVHGDLHLSNVVVSSDGAHLVDFAWSDKPDHLLKDFVMLESSIRFMQFPEQVHPALVGLSGTLCM